MDPEGQLRLLFSKVFQTSNFRGSGPGDSTGCMAPGSPAASGGGGGPSGSSADTCGGPANTNYAFANSFALGLSRGKASLSLSLAIFNDFKHAFPADVATADNAALTGRSDWTWGIVAASYKREPLRFGLGISSYQPALDHATVYPRFPYWDFAGASANNYSQIFISAICAFSPGGYPCPLPLLVVCSRARCSRCRSRACSCRPARVKATSTACSPTRSTSRLSRH